MDPGRIRDRVTAELAEASETMLRAQTECADDVVRAAELLVKSLRGGGKLLLCGNGGSAADAQHLAAEFVSSLTLDRTRPSIPAVALTTDTSILTAIANDFGVDHVFERQVESLGRPGDVLVAISTSGNSPNVLHAARRAATDGLSVVALTGASGGALAPLADVAIRVPSERTAHIQECHLAIEQLLALVVEDQLYPAN
jgi:D-sedoheptulose 7-phosphate isomerase